MAQTKGKSKGWPTIGTLRKGDTGSYIKLADNVTILVDGQPIAMNEKRVVRLEDPRKKVEMMRDKGFIDERQAEERLEKLAGMEWLRYDLVVAPDRQK